MEFRVLGTIEVVDSEGTPIQVGGPRVQALLAAMLSRANEMVSSDWLVDAMWDGRPPRTATPTVHAYISRLRAKLMTMGRDGADRIATTTRGYRLRAEPEELDAEVFREHVARARVARQAGRLDEAAAKLDAGLGLWRGAALSGVDISVVRAYVTNLEESRIAAMEERLAISVDVGRDAEVVAELQELTSRHPDRERLAALLMLVLYRGGRSADALAAFQRIRNTLRDEHGLTPGVELVQLQQRILVGAVVEPVACARCGSLAAGAST